MASYIRSASSVIDTGLYTCARSTHERGRYAWSERLECDRHGGEAWSERLESACMNACTAAHASAANVRSLRCGRPRHET
eukprot:360289-Chlamydomonas_euryale.AAC.1